MKKVNLRTLYEHVQEDIEVDVIDAVYDFLESCRKKEKADRERIRRNKAYYSLDCEDGIENSYIMCNSNGNIPENLFFKKERELEVLKAICALPTKQANRIYLFFYEDLSITEIAKLQGVTPSSVSQSIILGLKNLKKNIIL